jgi:photosystem II stability/assembly factor-like uncharacterized protein
MMRFVHGLALTAGLALSAAAAPAPIPSAGALKWRVVGPYRGGRTLAVTGVPGHPDTFYLGAAAGGVWKSENGGADWKPILDKEPIASIGAIAVAPSDPNIVYVGSGEACIRGNISYGNGVYRSSDAGATWTHLGLDDTRHIGRVAINPRDPNTVFVAALGHAFGPNADRGLFRTTDGGKSWKKVLYKDDRSGAIDVALDPANPSVVYAALWEVRRRPWNMASGGPGSGLYKSIDGGATWKRLEGNGLPKGILGRIGITVSPADGNRVYALIEAEDGGLYRSDDAGATWKRTNDDERYRQRAWYFSHIFADPKSPDTVYVLNTGLFRSADGGKTFELLPAPHGDHHGLWIDPDEPRRMINGNDGGATITTDSGKTWSRQDNQPTAQFYHVIADNRFPYWLYGAQQDNSSVAIASRGETWGPAITDSDWYSVGGGESGFIAPDPRDADIVYAGDNGGVLTRYDRRRKVTQSISPWPLDTSGRGAGELEHRFQWTEPVLISPHNPDVLYTASEVVWKSVDHGMSWTAISPDLTRNDKSKQQPSGGPITLDITSVEYYDTVFALAESPQKRDLLWVGTDDGLVQITRDGGKSWKNVTPRGFPEWATVSVIDASPHAAGTAYVAVDGHRLDDFRPYVFRTTDFGASWTPIAGNLPVGAYVHAVRVDPVRPGLLFAGTELGVWVSFDDGASWRELRLNMPVTPVTDLIVKGDDLAVATNGRSFWILDDIAPLRQEGPAVTAGDAFLFTPPATTRVRVEESIDRRSWVGKNPSGGVRVDYFLKKEPAGDVTLEVLDGAGKVVRAYSSADSKRKEEQPQEWPDLAPSSDRLPTAVGANRFVWDLRYEPPTRIPGAFYTELAPEGPVALPGKYTLRLTVGGKSSTVPLELRLDPRLSGSEAAVAKEFALGLAVRDELDALHVAVNQIRAVRAELGALGKRLGDKPAPAHKDLAAAAADLEKKMAAIEGELVQVKRKSSEGNLRYPSMLDDQYDVFRFGLESDSEPTKQQLAVHEQLAGRLKDQLTRWKGLVGKEIPALNDMVKRADIVEVHVP